MRDPYPYPIQRARFWEPFWNENTWNGLFLARFFFFFVIIFFIYFHSGIVRMVVYAIPHILSFGTEGTDERNEKVVNHLAITKWLTKTKLLVRGKFKFFRRAWEKKPQSVFRLFFGTIVFSLFSIDSDHSHSGYSHPILFAFSFQKRPRKRGQSISDQF